MDADKQTFEVQIAGLGLKLRSSHDSATVHEMVDLVNRHVQSALDLNPQITFQKALLLASLHIAEDLVFIKRTAHQELGNLEIKAKKILSELESSPITRQRIEI